MLTIKAPTIVKRELTNQGFIKATEVMASSIVALVERL